MDNNNLQPQDGVFKTPKDAGEGKQGIVKRWLAELDLADKLEKDWRKDGEKVKDIYRNKNKKRNTFNILWANTEVLRPNLYNSTPRPDVRRRYRDTDPVGKQCALVIERALSFEVDSCDFDNVMNGVVFDYTLPGRGVSRVRFEPTYNEVDGEKILSSAKVYPQLEHWERFRRGPGALWDDVSWIAYQHAMTKSEVDKKFKDFGNKVNYDFTIDGVDREKAETEPNVFQRVCIWEIWDKETKKIIWIAPSYPDAPLLEEEDKLKLQGFFDTPRPVYAIDDTTSLVPVTEYTQYEEQAKELNLITLRINKLVEGLKVRGIYDATIEEMGSLLRASDNDLIPSNSSTMAMQAGGMDKAIWMMPIEQIAKVLAQLYIQREQVKSIIYEIVGISDILRGESNPNETLGAQELKANNSSIRLQRRQREIQRYARDLMCIMAEIMAEHYTPEFLSVVSGIQVTPEMLEVLRRDLPRGIRIDIETDSTIAADQAKDRKDVAEVMEAVGGFVTNFAPAVQGGAVSMEAAKKVLLSIVRKARLGREVEDAIEQDAEKPQQQQPNPEQMKVEAEIQARQAELQLKQQESQANLAIKQQESQNNLQSKQSEMQMKAEEMAVKMQLERERIAGELQLKREQMLLEMELKKQEMGMRMEIERERSARESVLSAKKAESDAQIKRESQKQKKVA